MKVLFLGNGKDHCGLADASCFRTRSFCYSSRTVSQSASNTTKLPKLKRPYFKSQYQGDGYKMLPSLDTKEKLETIQTYRKALSEISGNLGLFPGWVYSWTSTRDRHSSNVIKNFEFLRFKIEDSGLTTFPTRGFLLP